MHERGGFRASKTRSAADSVFKVARGSVATARALTSQPTMSRFECPVDAVAVANLTGRARGARTKSAAACEVVNRDPEEFAGEGVDLGGRSFSELRRRARAADDPARRSRLESLTRASPVVAMA